MNLSNKSINGTITVLENRNDIVPRNTVKNTTYTDSQRGNGDLSDRLV